MPRAGFEPATPSTKRRQTDALDRAATGIGIFGDSSLKSRPKNTFPVVLRAFIPSFQTRIPYVRFQASIIRAVRTSETSVDNHFTQQYIPEDNSEQQECLIPTLARSVRILSN
jgi:hypothetical protein